MMTSASLSRNAYFIALVALSALPVLLVLSGRRHSVSSHSAAQMPVLRTAAHTTSPAKDDGRRGENKAMRTKTQELVRQLG